MALWTSILRDDITSVVIWAGVSDVAGAYLERPDMRRMMKRLYGGTPTKVPEVYQERTPLDKVHAIAAPVLIIHGTKDRNVPMQHAGKLESALVEAGKAVDTWYYEGLTHFFPPAVNRQVVQNLCRWMRMQ